MIVKKLSIHRPSKKDYKKEMFGHYLAGLIDGDGHISSMGHIVIAFNLRDIKTAKKIRSTLKYGKVRKVKNKNACNLIISNKNGIIYIASLIKNKLRHPTKIHQFNCRLVSLFGVEKTAVDFTINWNTPWFSGFFDADGYLRIYIVKRKDQHREEVRLLGQLDQKSDLLLEQIKSRFGGYVGYRQSQNTFYYSTVSFRSMFELLSYFDKFSPQSEHMFLKYIILRKAYLLVQNKKHLENSGLKKLYKFSMRLKNKI